MNSGYALYASPEQDRLDKNVPSSTIYHQAPTVDSMTDQWKTASGYITGKEWNVVEKIPGSTAQGTRRLQKTEVPVPDLVANPVVWPPKFDPVPVVYPAASLNAPDALAGPHLKLLKITTARPGPGMIAFKG